MNTIRDDLMEETNDCAITLQELQRTATDVQRLDDHCRARLNQLDDQIFTLLTKGLIKNREVIDQLTKIRSRIERLRELRNMAEYGAFTLQVNRTVQKGYDTLFT